MMNAEHRRPAAAFLLVFSVACLIMVNGLRTQVVEVLIGAGTPRVLITAIAPDMVLGQSLNDAPEPPQATPPVPREVPSTPESQDVDAATTVTEPAARPEDRPANRPRAGNTVSKPDQAAGPVAPGDAATPEGPSGPTAPKPEPTPVPGPRPGFAPTLPPVPDLPPLLPGKDSRGEAHHSGWQGWGDDLDRADRGRDKTRWDRARWDGGRSDKGRSDKGRDESRSGFQATGGSERGGDRDHGDRGRDRSDRDRSDRDRSGWGSDRDRSGWGGDRSDRDRSGWGSRDRSEGRGHSGHGH